MLEVEETHLFQDRQERLVLRFPVSPAVVGHKHNAGPRVREGMGISADCPTVLPVQKVDRVERTLHVGGLKLPVRASVAGVPDGAAVADRPAELGVDEAHIVEPGVLAQDRRGFQVAGASGDLHRQRRRFRIGGRDGSRRRADGPLLKTDQVAVACGHRPKGLLSLAGDRWRHRRRESMIRCRHGSRRKGPGRRMGRCSGQGRPVHCRERRRHGRLRITRLIRHRHVFARRAEVNRIPDRLRRGLAAGLRLRLGRKQG